MGDRYDSAGEVLQKMLQPRDRLGVEVVRGLIVMGVFGLRSNMSGSESSNLANATRRRSPPDKVSTLASHGGKRKAFAAISSRVSRLCASLA